MALNLRTLNPELHAKLKSRAALEGKGVEAYVIGVLEEFDKAVGYGSVGAVPVAHQGVDARLEIARGALGGRQAGDGVSGDRTDGEDDSGAGQGPKCSVCEGALTSVKGKWACSEQTCSRYGAEQKVKR